MQGRRGDEPHIMTPEPALRVIMRRLREIMAEPGDGQSRLDKIVHLVAGVMVAEVCSIYLRRRDGSLELFATEGLNREAVHTTRLNRGEGLVGRCAELSTPINEPDAQHHPAFSYRPETGEELYHSLLAVPIQRSGQLLGVLVVQNHTMKQYTDEDEEVMQVTAMIVAEHLVSGTVAGSDADIELSNSLSAIINGEPISEGIALGHVVLHEPRVAVTTLVAEDPAAELDRLTRAVSELRQALQDMFDHEQLAEAGEHRDVLEAIRMFANDRGWERRLREAVEGGLTAEAAVERVQNRTRAQMLRQNDPYWRERMRDLDGLSDRLLRTLAGRAGADVRHPNMRPDTILVARTLGPAELLDYDRSKLRGLVVEDGSAQSHVAIVAKALGMPAVGQAVRIVERVAAGDAIIVDAVSGEVHLRPTSDVIKAYSDKVRFRAKRQRKYDALRDTPAMTKDGVPISLQINAGLFVDMSHLTESGADGVGLFRTELMFMMSDTIPRLDVQEKTYRQALDEAGGRPIVFRTLDVGGDKALPYLHTVPEENPAMGWRAVRMSLDRPALFRLQVRALIRATGERELSLMVPMISAAREIDDVQALVEKEKKLASKHGYPLPRKIRLGAMLEVPSLLFELDQLFERVDFVSIGSNDLMQFLFASDRTNAKVANRFDNLSVAPVRVLKSIVERAEVHGVPVTLCGEMAAHPLEAMVLIALGYRNLSMAPAAIGPVKAMILSLDADEAGHRVNELLETSCPDMRSQLEIFAKEQDVEL